MFSNFALYTLPSLPLSQRNSLPECPSIYFAIDSNNRVLYVGKAINLLSRWKNHHRQEQLNRINRKNPIKIAWLICPSELEVLARTETYFIEFYQPLLNQTPVPAKTIKPAEIGLQQSLRKMADLDVVVFGLELAIDSNPPTVYLKYPTGIWREKKYISNTGPINYIIQANNNRKYNKLKWREYERKKFYQFKVRSWKTSCNGVYIDLSPWRVGKETYLNLGLPKKESAAIKTLAGVEMLVLSELELTKILDKYPFIKENYLRVCALKYDPIPLLWSKQ